MRESRELETARRCLAEAESQLGSDEGLARLTEGLDRLDGLISGGAVPDSRTARNLAASYASRVYERIRTLLGRDAQVPEPELEHYFKAVLAFDQVSGALPPEAAELKVAVVRALIDRYYEGHPPEKKRRALEQLAGLAPRV